MVSGSRLVFHPFRLDLANAQVWRDTHLLPLRPKPFALLRYLAEHPGRLVTKEELTKAVWPTTYVGESSLKGYIRDLRNLLGDNAERPRFIETVARRGYRFVAFVTKEEPPPQFLLSAAALSPPAQEANNSPMLVSFVGRERELAQLQEHFATVLRGERHVVFVTGEPGIGKTTLVDAFVSHLSTGPRLSVGRGHCVAQHGAGEPYLPILEALSQLARGPDGERLLTVLRCSAPSWLVQLPALLEANEHETLQHRSAGTTRERSMRELLDAFDLLTTESPLVLVLEDVHWSDVSTVDVLAAVAQRRTPARLLVLATYRPVDVIMGNHPLRPLVHELHVHDQCTELALTSLTVEQVRQYLMTRFPQHRFPQGLGRLLHQQTEGNPLFLVTMVDELIKRRLLTEQEGQWQAQVSLDAMAIEAPASIKHLLQRQFERLSTEEQGTLEVASAAGAIFSSAVVAVGLDTTPEHVEASCERLIRHAEFLVAHESDTWPDGTLTGRYQFRHALYQHIVYEQLGEAQRVRIHRRIGARLERGYGQRAYDIAAELALHFEKGQDWQKAVEYGTQAAQQALQRSAYTEALHHLTHALALLPALPETPERQQSAMMLHLMRGVCLTATKGFAAQEAEQAYTQALLASRQLGRIPAQFPVLRGLISFHLTRAEYQTARSLGEELLVLAQQHQNPSFLLEATLMQGVTLFHIGEAAMARPLFEQILASYDPRLCDSHTFLYGQDPAVVSLSQLAYALYFLGYPEQALQKCQEAIGMAHAGSHPFNLMFALYHLVVTTQLCRAYASIEPRVEELLQFVKEQGYLFFEGMATVIHGRLCIEHGQLDEGLRRMQEGLTIYHATGAQVARPFLLALIAEGYGKKEEVEEGLRMIQEALTFVQATGERFYEAELYRLRGELLLQAQSLRHPSRTQTVTQASIAKPRMIDTP